MKIILFALVLIQISVIIMRCNGLSLQRFHFLTATIFFLNGQMVFVFAAPVGEGPEDPKPPLKVVMSVDGGNGGSTSVGNSDGGGDKTLQFLDNSTGHFGGSFISTYKFIEPYLK